MSPKLTVVFPDYFIRALDRYCGGDIKVSQSKVIRALATVNLSRFPLLQNYVEEERGKFETTNKRHKNSRKVEGRLR